MKRAWHATGIICALMFMWTLATVNGVHSPVQVSIVIGVDK